MDYSLWKNRGSKYFLDKKMVSGCRISRERSVEGNEDIITFRDQDDSMILKMDFAFWNFLGPKTRDDIAEKMQERYG